MAPAGSETVRVERVIVVGAGVIGLSCAVRLLEAGHDVHVLARDLPLETTSSVAAALWYPYRAAPEDRVRRWGSVTYDELAALADVEGTGVRMRAGTELLREAEPDPSWADGLLGYEVGDAAEPYAAARRFTSPVADMSVYLPWLVGRVEGLGGTVTRMALPALPREGVVVNTTGLGSRGIAGDDTLSPLRGQIVVLEQFGLTEWSLEGTLPTYVVPREHTVVVGGTADEGDWNVQPDRALVGGFLRRAHDLLLRTGDPALADRLRRAEIVAHKVGLRPSRPEVRCEEEVTGDLRVVHCYGHGGAGVTLSWGCADDVVGLLA